MPSYISRDGQMVKAGAVFDAWTSQDLGRMLAVRNQSSHPVDRHFLLMGIVAQSYNRRSEPAMRELCLEVGFQHVREFAAIIPALKSEMGGILPRVPTFALLATALAEDERFEEAINVCRTALSHGLRDGTKGDFPARITRLQKAAATRRARAV